MLNLASLNIEKGIIIRVKNGINSNSTVLFCKKWKIKTDGTMENVIKSEKESNWAPILDLTFKIFAKYPSKKSNIAPRRTKYRIWSCVKKFNEIAAIANMPQKPFKIVRKFGSILINFKSWVKFIIYNKFKN